uniref:Os08g0383700 protein n=1 Tax=Macrostomum lignano TaxID=282301 RepID=A0A1I8I9S2_9PLAT
RTTTTTATTTEAPAVESSVEALPPRPPASTAATATSANARSRPPRPKSSGRRQPRRQSTRSRWCPAAAACRRCRLAKHSPPTWLGFAGDCWPIRRYWHTRPSRQRTSGWPTTSWTWCSAFSAGRTRKAPARHPACQAGGSAWRSASRCWPGLLADFVRRYARGRRRRCDSAARTVAAVCQPASSPS